LEPFSRNYQDILLASRLTLDQLKNAKASKNKNNKELFSSLPEASKVLARWSKHLNEN